MINLHTHSKYSDGRESPADLVRLAAASGIKILGLSDHDMTFGVAEALEEGKQKNVRVIPAVEISSRFFETTIHILGYHIDVENAQLQKLLRHLRDFRREGMLEKVQEILATLPLDRKFDIEEFIFLQGEYFCPPKTADFLIGQKIAATKREAWELIKGVKVAAPDVQPQHAIEAIHGASGIAVLAHPFGPHIGISSISENLDKQRELFQMLKDQGLDGIECYQLSHVEADVQKALVIAHEFDFSVTAGSDWHGQLSLIGETIKDMIPRYSEHFGDFKISDEMLAKIIDDPRLRLHHEIK